LKNEIYFNYEMITGKELRRNRIVMRKPRVPTTINRRNFKEIKTNNSKPLNI